MKKILFVISLLIGNWCVGQDIHFSQFYFAPQYLSPAEIGNFAGKYRLNTNQKTQWKQVSTPYSTFALSGDGKFDFLPKNISLGLSVLSDQAGDSRFKTFSFLPGASYKLDLNKKSALMGGVQMGFSQISIDESDLSFNNQHNGAVYDPNLPNGENFSRNSRWYFNLNIGANYIFAPEFRKKITIGFAAHNLTSPDQSFFNETGVTLPLRTSLYGNGDWKVNEDFDIMPSVRWMSQAAYDEVLLGSALRYTLLRERDLYRAIFVGYYGRINDSGIAMAGFELDRWRFAMSYDINMSDLDVASRNRGGMEFSLQYIFGRSGFAPPVIHKFCPVYL